MKIPAPETPTIVCNVPKDMIGMFIDVNIDDIGAEVFWVASFRGMWCWCEYDLTNDETVIDRPASEHVIIEFEELFKND